MKLGVDELLNAPYKSCCFSASSALQVLLFSAEKGDPSSKNVFVRRQTTATD